MSENGGTGESSEEVWLPQPRTFSGLGCVGFLPAPYSDDLVLVNELGFHWSHTYSVWVSYQHEATGE